MYLYYNNTYTIYNILLYIYDKIMMYYIYYIYYAKLYKYMHINKQQI